MVRELEAAKPSSLCRLNGFIFLSFDDGEIDYDYFLLKAARESGRHRRGFACEHCEADSASPRKA